MADRYWVGGTGTWNSTSTTNWSASSGGAAGASVPTAADNVIFDAGSDAGGIFTVTMANSQYLGLPVPPAETLRHTVASKLPCDQALF